MCVPQSRLLSYVRAGRGAPCGAPSFVGEAGGRRRCADIGEPSELFGFLTTEANAVVAPIHPKAMPVILRSQEEADRWLEADTPDALALQRPLPEDALRIVAKGEKEDAPPRG